MTFAMEDEALAAGAALDLARGMAGEGWSTLLVDLAAGNATRGLADLARGEASAAAVLSRDSVSTAHLIGAGMHAQAADPDALASTLSLLAETYDRVVVNAGGLNGGGGALATAAIGVCEHALLVVPGATMTRAEHEAYEALAATDGLAVSVLSLADEDGLPAAA
jgi:hypothetical protein